MSAITGILVMLYRLDHPDGTVRLSTLGYDWTDGEGHTWLGAGAVLREGPVGPSADTSGGELTVVFSGATQALVAEAQTLPIRTRFWRGAVVLAGSPLAQVAGPFDTFAGICERPSIRFDPAGGISIELTVQSFMIDFARSDRVIFSGETQRRIDPADISADFVADLADVRLTAGR